MTSITLRQGSARSIQPAASAFGNVYQLAGRRFDAPAGLYYSRHRYYDPRSGRFLSRDPAGYADGQNLYAALKNNPVGLVDALGLKSTPFDKLQEKLRDKFDEALDDVGGPETEEGEKLEELFEEAKKQLLKQAAKGGKAALSKATLILDYVEFEFRVAVAIVDAGGKIMNQRAACTKCLETQPQRTLEAQTWTGGTIPYWVWSFNPWRLGFHEHEVECKCIYGRTYATVPQGNMWVPCH